MIKLAEQRLDDKPNVKIVVGVEVVISKPSDDDDGEGQEKASHAHTMPEAV